MRNLAGLLFLVMLAASGAAAAMPPTVPAVLERLAAVPDGFSGVVGVWRGAAGASFGAWTDR